MIPLYVELSVTSNLCRPILSAIKNHKDNPYFLGTAMHALASIAESGMSLI